MATSALPEKKEHVNHINKAERLLTQCTQEEENVKEKKSREAFTRVSSCPDTTNRSLWPARLTVTAIPLEVPPVGSQNSAK